MSHDAFSSQRHEPDYAPHPADHDYDPLYDEPDERILSVEPDDPLNFADPDLIRLGLTLDFGPGDLAANQEGLLSPAQIARLEMDLRWFYWPMIAALAVFALLLSLAGIAGGTWSVLPLALVVLSLGLVPAGIFRREQMRLPQRAVPRTTLRMGTFALTIVRWGLGDSEKVHVDSSRDVFCPKHLYKVLHANQTYLAYYSPVRTWKGYRLLSLEPLDSAPEEKPKRKPKR